jgi:putative transposon-encoded protein
MAEKIEFKTKTLTVDPEDIEVKTVAGTGNGAKISYYKKHIGKEVYVILKDKCKLK